MKKSKIYKLFIMVGILAILLFITIKAALANADIFGTYEYYKVSGNSLWSGAITKYLFDKSAVKSSSYSFTMFNKSKGFICYNVGENSWIPRYNEIGEIDITGFGIDSYTIYGYVYPLYSVSSTLYGKGIASYSANTDASNAKYLFNKTIAQDTGQNYWTCALNKNVTIDLKNEYTIKASLVSPWVHIAGYGIDNYTIYYSSDNLTWTKWYSSPDLGTSYLSYVEGSGVTARYWLLIADPDSAGCRIVRWDLLNYNSSDVLAGTNLTSKSDSTQVPSTSYLNITGVTNSFSSYCLYVTKSDSPYSYSYLTEWHIFANTTPNMTGVVVNDTSPGFGWNITATSVGAQGTNYTLTCGTDSYKYDLCNGTIYKTSGEVSCEFANPLYSGTQTIYCALRENNGSYSRHWSTTYTTNTSKCDRIYKANQIFPNGRSYILCAGQNYSFSPPNINSGVVNLDINGLYTFDCAGSTITITPGANGSAIYYDTGGTFTSIKNCKLGVSGDSQIGIRINSANTGGNIMTLQNNTCIGTSAAKCLMFEEVSGNINILKNRFGNEGASTYDIYIVNTGASSIFNIYDNSKIQNPIYISNNNNNAHTYNIFNQNISSYIELGTINSYDTVNITNINFSRNGYSIKDINWSYDSSKHFIYKNNFLINTSTRISTDDKIPDIALNSLIGNYYAGEYCPDTNGNCKCDIMINVNDAKNINDTNAWAGPNYWNGQNCVPATNVPANITSGWYGYRTSNLSHSWLLTLKTKKYQLIEYEVNISNLNSVWTIFKNQVYDAYNYSMRTSLNIYLDFNYNNQTLINQYSAILNNTLDDLIIEPYLSTMVYIQLESDPTQNATKVYNSFASHIIASDNTNNKFPVYCYNNCTGIITAYIRPTPFKYISNLTKASILQQEAYLLRNSNNTNRIYEFGRNTTLMTLSLDINEKIYDKMRDAPKRSQNFSNLSIVQLNNNDFIVFNFNQTPRNYRINISNLSTTADDDWWDETNGVIAGMNTKGLINVTVPAYDVVMVYKTQLDRIELKSNNEGTVYYSLSSNYSGMNYTDGVVINANNYALSNTNRVKIDMFDPMYKVANNLIVYYGWLNVSYTNFTKWANYFEPNGSILIIADKNAGEIAKLASAKCHICGYISVASYDETNSTWVAYINNRTKEWYDLGLNCIFFDGLDYGMVSNQTDFNAKMLLIHNFAVNTLSMDDIFNTYTYSESFCHLSTLGCMKESCLMRWNGPDSAHVTNYTYENFILDRQKADWYESHGVDSMCMIFANASDTYENYYDLYMGSKVLGHKYIFISQPNFQIPYVYYFPDVGTMIWNDYLQIGDDLFARLYSEGMVYYNTTSHEGWIDDGRTINSADAKFRIYGAPGNKLSVNINNGQCLFNVTNTAGWVTNGTWQNATLDPACYSMPGRYRMEIWSPDGLNIYRRDYEDISHSWYSTDGGVTWTVLFGNENWIVHLNVNATKSGSLDTTDKIIQTISTPNIVNGLKAYLNLTSAYSFDLPVITYGQNFSIKRFNNITLWNGSKYIELNWTTNSDCMSSNPTWKMNSNNYYICHYDYGNDVHYVKVKFPHLSNQSILMEGNNTPPVVTNVNISPLWGHINTTFTCNGIFSDVDGDIEKNSTFRWFKYYKNNYELIPGATSKTYKPGQLSSEMPYGLICEYTPADGYEYGTPVNSSGYMAGVDFLHFVDLDLDGYYGSPVSYSVYNTSTLVKFNCTTSLSGNVSLFFGKVRNTTVDVTIPETASYNSTGNITAIINVTMSHGIFTWNCSIQANGLSTYNTSENNVIIISNPPTHSTPIINSSNNRVNATKYLWGLSNRTINITAYNISSLDTDGDKISHIWVWLNDTFPSTSPSKIQLVNMPFEGGTRNTTSLGDMYAIFNYATETYSAGYNTYWLKTGGHDNKGALRLIGNSTSYIYSDTELGFEEEGVCTGSTYLTCGPCSKTVVLCTGICAGYTRMSCGINKWQCQKLVSCGSFDQSTCNMYFGCSWYLLSPPPERTYSLWIKLGDSQQDPYYAEIIGSDILIYNVTHSRLQVLDNYYNSYTSNTNITKNVWHHIAAVFYRNNTVKFYLDGEYDGWGNTMDSASTYYIGVYDGTGAYPLNATIDDLIIYKRALSSSQIKALYQDKKNVLVGDELSGNQTWTVYTYINDGYRDGNKTISNPIYTILDSAAPNVTLITPLNSFLTSNTNITFIWKTIDGLDANLHCNLTIDGVNNVTYMNIVNNTISTISRVVPQGHHNWSVTCWDHYGNTNTSEVRSFTVDTTPPNVALKYPTNNQILYDSVFTMVYNTTDVIDEVKNCSLYINETLKQVDTSITETINQTWNVNLERGKYNWTVQCYDYAGNKANATKRNFTIQQDTGGSGSGGGSGGGGSGIPAYNLSYEISPRQFDIKLLPNETKSYEFYILNKQNKSLIVTLSTDVYLPNGKIYTVPKNSKIPIKFLVQGTTPGTIYSKKIDMLLNDNFYSVKDYVLLNILVVAKKDNYESCNYNSDCLSGYCDPVTKLCKPNTAPPVSNEIIDMDNESFVWVMVVAVCLIITAVIFIVLDWASKPKIPIQKKFL